MTRAAKLLTESLRSAESLILSTTTSINNNLESTIMPILPKVGRQLMMKSIVANLSAEKLLRGLFYTPRLCRHQSVPNQQLNSRSFGSAAASIALSKKEAARSSQTPVQRDIHSILGHHDLTFLTKNIKKLIESDHPILNTISAYYFSSEGKKLRPLLVLLCAKMYNNSSLDYSPTILAENNVSGDILDSQYTLAYSTELIHTASLLHDDVIDNAKSRRNSPSANLHFGNKISILAGDYLLSRASVALAQLRNCDVVELLAECIGDLVHGEVLQLNPHVYGDDSQWLDGLRGIAAEGKVELSEEMESHFQSYIRKTYMKTASLIAKSCQASILLRNTTDFHSASVAYEFGRNIGIAFQLIDDLLDYTATAEQLGKPSEGSDLKLGLATAPLLFASLENNSLRQYVGDSFSKTTSNLSATEMESLLTRAVTTVRESKGPELTRQLAIWYQKKAVDALTYFDDGPARSALQNISESVITRMK